MKLTKEEINILNELCFEKMIKIQEYYKNEFVDKKQLKSYENKLKLLLDKLI